MPQTQRQELESLIRQRRLYLQGQDNQIQRNLKLLSEQDKQIAGNKAKIAEQQETYDSLTKDAQTVLESLRKQAEATPSKRYKSLVKQCELKQQEISVLDKKKIAILETVSNASSQLDKLDMEIIEADAIFNDLKKMEADAKKRLSTLNRRAAFQASVVTGLEYDIQQYEKKIPQAEKLIVELEKQQSTVAKDINNKQAEFNRLKTDIIDKQEELRVLNNNLNEVTKSLEALLKKEKTFRQGLAEEKQRLEQEQDNIKLSRQEIRHEIQTRQMIEPKWQPKPIEDLKHFKL